VLAALVRVSRCGRRASLRKGEHSLGEAKALLCPRADIHNTRNLFGSYKHLCQCT
jgi:hypothetical protein